MCECIYIYIHLLCEGIFYILIMMVMLVLILFLTVKVAIMIFSIFHVYSNLCILLTAYLLGKDVPTRYEHCLFSYFNAWNLI